MPTVALPYRIETNRVWRTWRGGRILDEINAAPEPRDGSFPEDWIASITHAVNPGREHLVHEGLGTLTGVDGRTIRMDELIAADPEFVLGAGHVAAYGTSTRLLVKLLDSADRLHIQAHPSAQWASERLGSPNGKTEAWWILQVRDGETGWVYMGFQHPPTPERWRELVDTQDLDAMEACFEKIPVRAGDVLLIEGGVPHAIGPGLLLLEVQEPTDYVVRCEYGSGATALPESARTMGLGLDAVLDLFDYRPCPAREVRRRFGPRPRELRRTADGSETALLAAPQTDRLELRTIRVDGAFAPVFDGRFSVLLVLDGAGTIRVGDSALDLKPWSRVLLPAALEEAELHGRLTVARCLPPLPPPQQERPS